MRLRPRQRHFGRRALWLTGSGVLGRAALLVPPAILAYQCGAAFLGRTNYLLTQATPLISQEVGRTLQRRVSIGSLTPNLTVRTLWQMVRRPSLFGTLPIVATDIVLTNSPDESHRFDQIVVSRREYEARTSRSPIIARADRVSAYVSLPTLLSGDVNGAIERVVVSGPEIFLVRDPKGEFNILRIAPPKDPQAKPSPPLRTLVEIENGRVRFRDYQAKNAPRYLPEVNDLDRISGFADLAGAREYRFGVTAYAAPKTATARRLTGAVRASAVAGRGAVGLRLDSPSPESARYLAQLSISGADVPYWYYYFVAPSGTSGKQAFVVRKGRADVELGLAAPRPDLKGGPLPGVGISIAARVVDGSLTSDYLPVALTNANAAVTYNDGTVAFDGSGRVFGETITTTGTLWNLTIDKKVPSTKVGRVTAAPAASVGGEMAVSISAPRLPIARLLPAFLPPKNPLPRQLRLGSLASANVTLSGPFRDFVATGRVSNLAASYEGFPAARNIATNFTYAGGVLNLSDLNASLDGGGQLTGRGGVRVVSANPREKNNAVFSLRAANVDLAAIRALRVPTTAGKSGPNLRLSGRGEVTAVGRTENGLVTAAANVSTSNLRVGDLAFPVARARVLFDRGSVAVPAAQIESPAGAVFVTGGVAQKGALDLRFAATSLDLGSLARAFGQPGVRGHLTASGTVSGTVQKPRATIARLSGIDLRYLLTSKDGSRREINADTLTASNLVATRDGISLPEGLIVRRFPALLSIAGSVNGLSAPAANGKIIPRLNLTAKVSNLDFATIQKELGAAQVAPKLSGAQNKDLVAAAKDAAQSVSGQITEATVRATGPVNDVRLVGNATLGRLLAGPYPLDSGTIQFAYDKSQLTVSEATLTGSVGTVTASGTLAPDGTISGAFAAPRIDAQKLSFLTNKFASLDGIVGLSGTVSGSTKKPVVTAQITPSTLIIAGTTLSNVTAAGIRFAADTEKGQSRLDIPAFSFQQAGSTIALQNSFYDPSTGRFALELTAETGDIGVFLDTIRRSGLRDTEQGAGLVSRLNALPNPLTGQLTIRELNVSGRLAETRDIDGKTVRRLTEGKGLARIEGADLRVGPFEASTVRARATLAGEQITLERFLAVSPAATLRANGTFGLDGSLNAVVESNAADLDSLKTIPALSRLPFKGAVDLAVRAESRGGKKTFTATVSGSDLLFLPPAKATSLDAVAGPAASQAAAAFSLPISVFRAEGQLVQEANGLATIQIPEIFVKQGEAEIRAEGTVPVSFDANDQTLSDRQIALALNVKEVDLANFAPLFAGAAPEATQNKKVSDKDKKPAVNVGGLFAADLNLTGSLHRPALGGTVTMKGGKFTLPRAPGDDRDKVNPITNFDAAISIEQSRINFDNFVVALGGPNNKTGSYGSLAVTGGIRINNLEDLQNLLKPQNPGDANAAGPPQVGGTLDLTAKLNDLRPVEEDVFQLGEAAQARLNGTLLIKGPLLSPRITTENNAPIRVADAAVRLSSKVAKPNPNPAPPVINPSFDVPLVIDGKASLADLGSFRFDVNGSASINGALAVPGVIGTGLNIAGDLNTVSGYYQFPTFRFNVQRDGIVALRFNASDPGIRARDVVVKANISSQANLSLYDRSGGRPIAASAVSPISAGQSTRYAISATFNGPLNILSSEAALQSNQRLNITFDSDPALTNDQIIALLGSQAQLDQARQGDVEGAIRGLATQAVWNGYLPRYLAPITDGLQSAFGLQDLAFDYNPDGSSSVFLAKRLPRPFESFVIDFKRSFQFRNSGASTGTSLQPYRYSLSYDLFRFSPSSRYLPRVQTGFSTDEQRTTTYFLRGTASF